MLTTVAQRLHATARRCVRAVVGAWRGHVLALPSTNIAKRAESRSERFCEAAIANLDRGAETRSARLLVRFARIAGSSCEAPRAHAILRAPVLRSARQCTPFELAPIPASPTVLAVAHLHLVALPWQRTHAALTLPGEFPLDVLRGGTRSLSPPCATLQRRACPLRAASLRLLPVRTTARRAWRSFQHGDCVAMPPGALWGAPMLTNFRTETVQKSLTGLQVLKLFHVLY